MIKKKIVSEIIDPKNQLYLYGYKKYFNLFLNLFSNKKLPNTILFNGAKGLGKSTFSYHLINFFLSQNEKNNYSVSKNLINENNESYKLVNENLHPNFFLIDNKFNEKEIKIDQIRNLLNFLHKSTYSNNLKIVLIDNIENLNINSINAILKSIEEPNPNTFFILIHNSAIIIPETIISRCFEFKLFFNQSDKKDIFKNLTTQYKKNIDVNLFDDFYFETPGNLLKYCSYLENSNINIKNDNLNLIFYFIDKYLDEKNPEFLSFISVFIEKFYKDLCFNARNKINLYMHHRSKMLMQLHEMKRFNLSEKNTFYWIKETLSNEAK